MSDNNAKKYSDEQRLMQKRAAGDKASWADDIRSKQELRTMQLNMERQKLGQMGRPRPIGLRKK